jgi:hypothetical protein
MQAGAHTLPQVARVGFEYYEKQGAPKLELLDKPSQLALLLAHEKPQGADSFFYPYVDALPDRPSAAWALDDVQLDAALAALPAAVTAEERAKWRQEAIRQRGVIETHSQRTYSSHPLVSALLVTAIAGSDAECAHCW